MLLSLAGIALALALAERQAALTMAAPGPLRQAASGLHLDPLRRHVVVLGTCLSGQHISKWSVERGLGPGWQVENLGTAGSTPVEWYLAWKNLLPRDRIDVLLLAYGRYDLTEPLNAYETELLDLATPADVAEVARVACTTAECRLDLRLQASSALYRHRAVLAARVWAALGVRPPGDAALARTRVVEGLRDGRALDGGAEPSWVYLERLLAEARQAGSAVVLQPLPLRPDQPAPHQAEERARHAEAVAALAARTGAVLMPPEALAPDAFEDEVHLLKEPMERFSVGLGQRLAEVAD